MKVGFIGAGRMATTMGRHLIGAGHEVVLSNSRGPEALAGLVADLGPAASAGSKQDAAECDVVILATNWAEAPEALKGSTGAAAYSLTVRTPTWMRNRTSAPPA
jgi:predicted dinucleotide-binding enzyme